MYVGVIRPSFFNGRALKSTTLPRLPGIMETKRFDSLSSSSSEVDN